MNDATLRNNAMTSIATERNRQIESARDPATNTGWDTDFDDTNTIHDWASYMNRYLTFASANGTDPAAVRENLVKVGALAVAAIEAVDRNGGMVGRHYDEPNIAEALNEEAVVADISNHEAVAASMASGLANALGIPAESIEIRRVDPSELPPEVAEAFGIGGGQAETESGMIRGDLSDEEWREYDFDGRVVRIEDPIALVMRPGGTTHRIIHLNEDGTERIVTCVPAPGYNGCVLRWGARDGAPLVNF